jgi:transcription elongation factor GreA
LRPERRVYAGGVNMQGDQRPIYLTVAGRQRLERRLEAYEAELREADSGSGKDEAEDAVDEATDLEAADHVGQLRDLIEATRAVLAQALPLPSGPADSVVRQGSTVQVRDQTGEERALMLVDGAELDPAAEDVSTDSPVGQALLGRVPGDRVAVETPEGQRILTVLSVMPYRGQ